MIFADWVRLLVLTGAALLFGATFVVCISYARQAVRMGLRWREVLWPMRSEPRWTGLLPWHVFAISLSYDLLLLRSLLTSLERWGTPQLNVQGVVLTIPAIVLGLAAMWIIGNTKRVTT